MLPGQLHAGVVDLQVLHAGVEEGAPDAQESGGLRAVAVGRTERSNDELSFQLFQVAAQIEALGAGNVARGRGGLDGKVGAVEHLGRRHEARVLERVPELPHVPRPTEFDEGVHGILGNGASRARHLAQERVDEKRDVLAPFAERRHVNAHDADAVEQILAQRGPDGARDDRLCGGGDLFEPALAACFVAGREGCPSAARFAYFLRLGWAIAQRLIVRARGGYGFVPARTMRFSSLPSLSIARTTSSPGWSHWFVMPEPFSSRKHPVPTVPDPMTSPA